MSSASKRPDPSLIREIDKICRLLAKSEIIDRSIIEEDIRARWHEAQAGRRWALARPRLQRDYKRRGISEEQGTKEDFGRSLASMRRRVQIYRGWGRYVAERRQAASGDYWGLLHGVSLIPVNRRYATNSSRTKVRAGTDDQKMLDPSMCRSLTGDSKMVLKRLADLSVQCIITSPPFWPLKRSFGGKGLGFEPTLEEYVTNLLAILAECYRVLADDGVLWLHMEDSYSHTGGAWRPDSFATWQPTSQKQLIADGLKMPDTTQFRERKCMLRWPEIVILCLIDQGWIVRSEIIWDKGFARPDSADDRPTVTHGKIFLLTKNPDYAYDADPLRVPTGERQDGKLNGLAKRPSSKPGTVRRDVMRHSRVYQNPLGRNSGTVWRCNVANYPGEHTAVLPLPLVRRMVLASCLDPGDVVLDPFGGPGTVAIAAMQCGFKAISIDIHKAYTQEAKERIAKTPEQWDDEPEPQDNQRIAELEAENALLLQRVHLLEQQAGLPEQQVQTGSSATKQAT